MASTQCITSGLMDSHHPIEFLSIVIMLDTFAEAFERGCSFVGTSGNLEMG